jgi:hypothetical protein
MKKTLFELLIFLLPITSFSQQESDILPMCEIPKHDRVIYGNDSIPLFEVSYMGAGSRIIKYFYQSGDLHELHYERRREHVTFIYDMVGNLIEMKLVKGRRKCRVGNNAGIAVYETKNTVVKVDTAH